MSWKQFIAGLLVWVGLLGLGGWLASNPLRAAGWLTSTAVVRSEFRIRLAPLPASKVHRHVAQIETENADDDDDYFDANDWALRETRYRFAVVLVLWLASGVFIHWFLGRIVRGEKDYT